MDSTGAVMGRPKKIRPEEPKPESPKKAGRPKSERDDIAIKFDRRLAGMAKLVAVENKMTLAEFVSEAARNAIEREYKKLVLKSAEPDRAD